MKVAIYLKWRTSTIFLFVALKTANFPVVFHNRHLHYQHGKYAVHTLLLMLSYHLCRNARLPVAQSFAVSHCAGALPVRARAASEVGDSYAQN